MPAGSYFFNDEMVNISMQYMKINQYIFDILIRHSFKEVSYTQGKTTKQDLLWHLGLVSKGAGQTQSC